MVARQDRVGVVRRIAVDVADGLVHAGHDLDADDRRQVLLRPVGLGRIHQLGARHASQEHAGFRVAPHLDALGGVHRADGRQKSRRHAAGDQQALAGVAGAVLLGLGVVGHGHRHRDVAGVVHIGVAVAVEVLDHRHPGFAADPLDQTLAAARDDHVHMLGHGDQVADGRAVGGGDHLHRVGGQAGFFQGPLHQRGQRLVGIDRLRSSPQDGRVAALDRQAGRLDRHVGPALEDHAEHAQRHPHLPHPDAAGLLAHAGDLADQLGHGGQLVAALGHRLEHLGRQAQPVDHRRGQAGGLGAGQVLGVLGRQGRAALAQQAGQGAQGAVLGGGVGARHRGRCGAGLQAEGVDVFGDVQGVHAAHFPTPHRPDRPPAPPASRR